jgi:hypothetical protein
MSNATVSMKLSLEATGALYMKSIRQEKRIKELESNILMLEQYNGSVESLIKDIKAHNLEQQAKGVEEATNDYSDNLDATMVYLADLDDRVIDLRNQANALKEQE